jgi:hypothetical protein
VERVEDRVALQGREVAGEGGAVGAAHDRAQVGQLPLAGRVGGDEGVIFLLGEVQGVDIAAGGGSATRRNGTRRLSSVVATGPWNRR